MNVCFLWNVCCQVQVSATGWSLVQRSVTEYCMSECALETSPIRRPRSTRAVAAWKRFGWTLGWLRTKKLIYVTSLYKNFNSAEQKTLRWYYRTNRLKPSREIIRWFSAHWKPAHAKYKVVCLKVLLLLLCVRARERERESSNSCTSKVRGKEHPCTGTEALHRPYGP